jgi:phthiocerol/phenolphthiocerol synthesis type-I polyketide synthase E
MQDVGDVDDRLTELSPARRRLVEQLLKARSAAIAMPEQPRPEPARAPAADGSDPKRSCRRFFDDINGSLDGTEFGRFSLFLNFGYVPVPGGTERAVVALPEHAISKSSVQLVLEVIGGCPIDGRRVLDIGCGRGGTATIVDQFFAPRRFVGVDLSGRAVSFCRRHRLRASHGFVQGDAENLPLPDASVDVAINIESSQSYPNVRNFYREVHRVLAPEGDFLYTDVLPVQRVSDWIGLLQATGLHLDSDRDITPNVLRSCDEVARQRRHAYQTSAGAAVMNNFLGTPGSHVYEEMKGGRWTYRIMRLRKVGS